MLGLGCYAQAFSSCGAQALHCSGSSGCRAWALDMQASVVSTHRLSCLHCMWDLPGQGIEPLSSALAARFLTTGPRRKSWKWFLTHRKNSEKNGHTVFAFLRCPDYCRKNSLWNEKRFNHHQEHNCWLNKLFSSLTMHGVHLGVIIETHNCSNSAPGVLIQGTHA